MAESPEDIAADMHKRIRYGIRYSDGTYETSPEMWEKRDANDIVVQTPEELYESNIGMCHDVTRALIKKLREKRIKHVAMMLTGDKMPNLPTHSFVVYDNNGKYTVLDPLSYATGSKGEYSSVREAVNDRIEDWKKEEEKGNIHSYRIPKKDWENRGLLDFLHFNGEKKAESDEKLDSSKWPSYDDYQKKHHDEVIDAIEEAMRKHFRRRRPWGVRLRGGRFFDNNRMKKADLEKLKDIVRRGIVRTGEHAIKANRGVCHDLASARLKILSDMGVPARRVFIDYENTTDPEHYLGHSMVFFKDKDGRYHHANRHMRDQNALGDFDSLEDAVRQHIADIRSSGELDDEQPVSVYDNTDILFPDEVSLKDYMRMSWEHGRKLYERGHEKKASDAKYSLKEDPTYEDALKVFDKLDFDDRANMVPRHPDFLRNVPDDMLFDRQVVVDGKGDPVGFQEFYSRKDKRGRRLPPHNIIAVAPEARGNGLAKIMVEAAIRKARKEKIKRLLWEAFADNEPSIRAAVSAGFKDVTPKNAKTYRKFVYEV